MTWYNSFKIRWRSRRPPASTTCPNESVHIFRAGVFIHSVRQIAGRLHETIGSNVSDNVNDYIEVELPRYKNFLCYTVNGERFAGPNFCVFCSF